MNNWKNELRLIGRGSYVKRAQQVAIKQLGDTTIEVHQYPQADGSWRPHISVMNPTNDMWLKIKKNANITVSDPWGKNNFNINAFTPQKTESVSEMANRWSKLIELSDELIS
jgi:hypothetical protein